MQLSLEYTFFCKNNNTKEPWNESKFPSQAEVNNHGARREVHIGGAQTQTSAVFFVPPPLFCSMLHHRRQKILYRLSMPRSAPLAPVSLNWLTDPRPDRRPRPKRNNHSTPQNGKLYPSKRATPTYR